MKGTFTYTAEIFVHVWNTVHLHECRWKVHQKYVGNTYVRTYVHHGFVLKGGCVVRTYVLMVRIDIHMHVRAYMY